jgi:hypothetical protein
MCVGSSKAFRIFSWRLTLAAKLMSLLPYSRTNCWWVEVARDAADAFSDARAASEGLDVVVFGVAVVVDVSVSAERTVLLRRMVLVSEG